MQTVRLECYEKIRNAVKQRMLSYYRQRPERLGDARSQMAIKESMDGLELIFNILDEYDIKHHKAKHK